MLHDSTREMERFHVLGARGGLAAELLLVTHMRSRRPRARRADVLTSLLSRTPMRRLPLDVALALCRELTSVVAQVHARGRLLVSFSLDSLELVDTGRLVVANAGGPMVAPELRRGSAPTVASDLYTLGWNMFLVLTGETPTQALRHAKVFPLHDVPAPSALNPAIDERVDSIVLELLAPNPEERPGAVELISRRLDNALDDLGVRHVSVLVRSLFDSVAALHSPRRLIVMEREPETEEVNMPQPLRFDGWAMASVVVSLAGAVAVWLSR